MVKAYSMHGEEEEFIRGFSGKTIRKKTTRNIQT
jgi:hypothetical protein